MEQKAPQKLFSSDGHQLLLAAMRIILPTEGHLSVGNIHEPVVGNSNAMGVAGEIVQHMERSPKRRFGVDHPIVPEERTKERVKGCLLRQRLKSARKNEFRFAKGFLQPVNELSAETRLSTFTGRKKA